MPSIYHKKYPDGRRQNVTCLQCSKITSVPNRTVRRGGGKFCSRACQGASKQTPVTVSCEVCKRPAVIRPSELAKGWRFCSWECRRVGIRGSGNANWSNDPDYRGWNWREVRMLTLERDSHRCIRCGGDISLLVHHITPWPISQNNDLSNLQTLCHGCHRKAHAALGARL